MVSTAMEAENVREEGGEGNGGNTVNCKRATKKQVQVLRKFEGVASEQRLDDLCCNVLEYCVLIPDIIVDVFQGTSHSGVI